MGNRYWNPSGAANWGDANVWAATDGGTADQATPTSSDDVYFTSTNVNNCAVAATANCNSISFSGGTGYSGTFSGSSALNVYGNMTLDSAMNPTYSGTITFKSTGTGKTITCDGETLACHITFDGVGGGWTLQDDLNIGAKTVTLTNGSFNTNGKTVTALVLSTPSTNTRSLTIDSSTINLSNTSGTAWEVTATGLTFSGTGSTINITGAGCNFIGAGLTYNNVNITGITTSGRTLNGATIANLTLSSTAASYNIYSIADSSLTVTGTLTITGTSALNRLFIRSSTAGTNRTITCNGTISASNCDFQDITGAGSASWDFSSATAVGNRGRNSGITGTTADDRFWVATSGGSWSSTSSWSTTDGGGSGASVPLPQDSVYFTNNSITSGSRTITVDVPVMGGSIDFSGVLNSPTLSFSVTNVYFYGNWTGKSGVNTNNTGSNFNFDSDQTITFTPGGYFDLPLIFNQRGGTVNLGGNFSSSSTSISRAVTFTSGTFNAGSYGMTAYNFIINTPIDLGSGTWTAYSTGNSPRPWNCASTVTGSNATVVINGSGTGAKTFTPGVSQTYGTVTIASDNVTIDSAVTIGTLNNNTAGMTNGLKLTAGQTVTITSNVVSNGSAGSNSVLQSTSAGSQATLSKTSGTVTATYMNIKDSNATGGATWIAGAGCVNVSGNSGWIFSFVKTINGLARAGVKTVYGLALASVKSMCGLQ